MNRKLVVEQLLQMLPFCFLMRYGAKNLKQSQRFKVTQYKIEIWKKYCIWKGL